MKTTVNKVQYFKDCKTLDEAKNLFRKLVFKLHPDHNNGEDQEFIKMYSQFENFRPVKPLTEDEKFNAEEFYNIVRQFDKLNSVLITFVGSFIWLEDEPQHEGSTKEQKEAIKDILIDGYNKPMFAGKRLKWYYSPVGYKQKFRSSKSFDEIKRTWGSKSYNPKQWDNKKNEQKQQFVTA